MKTIRDIAITARTLTWLAGIASLAAWVLAAVYADRQLHRVSTYKFGPGRHLAFFSDVLHRTSRGIDDAAVNCYSRAVQEDQLSYDRLADAHEDAGRKIRDGGKPPTYKPMSPSVVLYTDDDDDDDTDGHGWRRAEYRDNKRSPLSRRGDAPSIRPV